MNDRTLFYGLQLENEGSGAVESLSSYIKRLAFEHGVAPARLIQLMRERLGEEKINVVPSSCLVMRRILGKSPVGMQLLDCLQIATGQKLSSSTLNRFCGILSNTHLTHARTGRYCPICVREPSGLDGQIGQLLWEVQCVECCPKHGVLLRDRADCGAQKEEYIWFNRRPQFPGVCNRCGSIGFKCIVDMPTSASISQIWIAESVTRMLALSVERSADFKNSNLKKGLLELVNYRYKGQVVTAALDAGLGRTSIFGWIKGLLKPSLGSLMAICLVAEADIVSLMEGTYAHVACSERSIYRPKRAYIRANVSWSEIEAAVRLASVGEAPPSRRTIASRFKVNERTLRDYIPDAINSLVVARKNYISRESQKRYEHFMDAYSAAAIELAVEGKTITRRKLQRKTGLVGLDPTSQRETALQLVMERSRSQYNRT